MRKRVLASEILDKIAYILLLGYALVSCWDMDRLPAGLVSVSGSLFLFRYALAPYPLRGVPALQRAFGFFVAAVVISSLATWPRLEWDPAWSFVDRVITLPIAVLLCRTRLRALALLAAVAVSASVVSVDALLQLSQHATVRISGFFGHPVHLGEHLLLVTVFLLPLVATATLPRSSRILDGIALVLSVTALLFNATRAAWIAAGAVLLLHACLPSVYLRREVFRWRRVVLLLIVLGSTGVILASPALQQRLQSVTNMDYQSNSERVVIWHSAVSMIADHPVFGVGPNNFGREYQETYLRPEAKERHQRDAHNSYLSIAAELGLVGLAAFLYLLLCLFQYFYRRFRTSAEPEWALGGLFCLLAFCVYGFMNSMINTFWAVRLFCLLLGLAMAGDNLTKKN